MDKDGVAVCAVDTTTTTTTTMATTSSAAAVAAAPDYYAKGSTELAKETPLTITRLEPRRKLTCNSPRLVIALVGLPARGKSFVARKMEAYLQWCGAACEIFNVGRYRREAYAMQQQQEKSKSADLSQRDVMGACDASFFDATNAQAAALREQVASLALQDMLKWLDDQDADDEEEQQQHQSYTEDQADGTNGSDDPEQLLQFNHSNPDLSQHSAMSVAPGATGGAKLRFGTHGRVAIFDATNSTKSRRQWILEQCTSPKLRGENHKTGVVFVESVCDDRELIEENYRFKVANSPDFKGMSTEEAMADLRRRVEKYEEQYETIEDDSLSYIKVFNLSTKILVNHIYGRLAKEIVPALMAWHIGTRPVYLCRPGQTLSGIYTDGEDYVARNRSHMDGSEFRNMSNHARRRGMRGDSLGPQGQAFSELLLDHCYQEAHAFMANRASVRDMANTGTSISGLAPNVIPASFSADSVSHNDHQVQATTTTKAATKSRSEAREPFPLQIMTSTMPRAVDTVTWSDFVDIPVNQMSNLNPLDKGDFAGMELDEIKKADPKWYTKLERDPFGTRFPGGESYSDLIRRLTSVVIDVEQQVIPTLVVSHVSILQCLIAYFRNTPVEKCMSIEVPLHTLIKFTPVRGGGWKESFIPLMDGVPAAATTTTTMTSSTSIGESPRSARPLRAVESVSEISQNSISENGGGIIWDPCLRQSIGA